MTIEVPAGDHTLTIRFGDTPARTAGWTLSAFALVLLVVTTWISWSPAARRSEPVSDSSGSERPGRFPLADARPEAGSGTSDGPVSRSLSPFWILLPVALLLFKIAVADPFGWFRLQSTGLEVIPADRSVDFQVGEEIALIGYDWNPALPGETARLTLYWKALRTPELNYQVFVHLRDAVGAVVAQSDKLNPGDFPARRWPLDRYVRDPHRLDIPDGLPPGEYRLAVGLWKMAENERLPAYDPDGNLLGDSVFLETVIYP
jgi:hypothetical protein